MKGLLFVELSTKESNQDVHSSLAVLIKKSCMEISRGGKKHFETRKEEF